MRYLNGMKFSNIKAVIFSIFTAAALTMNIEMVSDEVVESKGLVQVVLKLLCSIDDYSITTILVVFFCFLLYKYSFSIRTLRFEEGMLGVLMALTLLFGRAFEEFSSTAILVDGSTQFMKTIVILSGYLLFFPQIVKVITHCTTQYNLYHQDNSSILNKGFDVADIVKYRRWVFIFIIVAWSITWIAFFPGIFQGDTEDIIYMSYNYHTNLADSVIRIDENNMWVDHHSVLYTILLGAFVKCGRAVAGDENIGIAVYTIIQGLFTAWVLSFSLSKLKKYGVCPFLRTCVLIFFALFPWMPRYALMATKDTIFADILMLYLLLIMDIVFETENQIKFHQIIKLIIYAVLMFLIRKNGLYVTVLSIPFLLWINKKWIKAIAIVMVCIFAVKFIYSDVILVRCQIPDGSVSAALTVPLQQTSRYLHYYPDEVTGEEREAINGVVWYSALSSNYEPNRSDYAKSCWRKSSDSRDLLNYFKVWAKMLLKHPLTYVAATANSNHGYFYPVVMDLSDFQKASDGSYQNANRDGYFDFQFADNFITRAARTILKIGDTFLERIPLINLVCTSALYAWMLIVSWVRSIVNKDRKLLMVVMPLLMLMLTIITGPCNGNVYHRFTYPVAMCIPVVMVFGFRNSKEIWKE